MNAQVAAFLNIQECEIKEIQVWAKVLFVKFVKGSPRFVSKKAIAPQISKIKVIEPMTYILKGRGSKKWLAKIQGTDPTYGLDRKFLTADEIIWDKKGMKEAHFIIEECGYYHDSDDDYILVFVDENNEFDYKEVCKGEVKDHFTRVAAKVAKVAAIA